MKQSWKDITDDQKEVVVRFRIDANNETGIIQISREKRLNALNQNVINALETVLTQMSRNNDIRSVIITGAGDKAFVAGADIKEFQFFKKNQAYELSKIGKEKLFNKIENFNKPVIAAINGYALGGGLELALACHIRVASNISKLGLPECTLGVLPGYGGTQKLSKIIGLGHAMELVLTGKIINAEEAYRIGLVNHLVSSKLLMEKCLEITKSFIKTSPESICLAINSINSAFFSGGDEIESQNFSKLFDTQNFKEGVSAFLEKRKAKYLLSPFWDGTELEKNK